MRHHSPAERVEKAGPLRTAGRIYDLAADCGKLQSSFSKVEMRLYLVQHSHKFQKGKHTLFFTEASFTIAKM